MASQGTASNRVALPGSERTTVTGATERGPVDPEEQAEITVHLRSRISGDEMDRMLQEISSKPVTERKYLTREQLAELRGADPADVARIQDFAVRHHLTVTRVDAGSRTISLKGKLGDLEEAFGVQLHEYQEGATRFRARSGPIYVPAEIASAIDGVFGLDTRPAARHSSRVGA